MCSRRQLTTASTMPTRRERSRPEPALRTLLMQTRRERGLHLLLDYDGTLVPLAREPTLAAPDQEVMSLLGELAVAEGIRLEIVSGRQRATLEQWFGTLPLALWAEHGFWSRRSPLAAWEAAADVPLAFLHKIETIFTQFARNTPGALVETKSASVAWHYRGAARGFGARQAHELRMLLGDALRNQPFEVLEGHKVIEVRLRGVSKALAASRLQTGAAAHDAVVAIGDDRTDEDLFRALPASSITIAVGSRVVGARFRVDDFRAVRQLLRQLVADAELEQEAGLGVELAPDRGSPVRVGGRDGLQGAHAFQGA